MTIHLGAVSFQFVIEKTLSLRGIIMANTSPHGAKPLRGLETTNLSTIGTAKFGRMFRWLEPAFSPKGPKEGAKLELLLTKIAENMVTTEFVDNLGNGTKGKFGSGDKNTPDAPLTVREKGDENPTIAAGYTYFGQFIDHDITFDPASSLQQTNDPDALVDFRTPRLDLDCLYGRGPADQPYLYEAPDRHIFSIGKSVGVNGMNRPDVFRLADGTALLGDKRNDENKIVVQIQALFLSFHNKVFKLLKLKFPGDDGERFNQTQRIVRWTYQWLVLNDYLKKITDPKIYNAMLPDTKGHKGPKLNYFNAHGDAYIPVEFAVAAFRFGHSMVRPSYSLNNVVIKTPTAKFKTPKLPGEFSFARIPVFVPKTVSKLKTDALNGFGEALPPNWGIDWNFFFGTPNKKRVGLPQIPQPSYRIDSRLVDPLGELPEFVAQGLKSPFISLAFRNLMRSVTMGLPSGQRIAHMMGFKPLTDRELWMRMFDDGMKDWTDGKDIYDANKDWLKDSAPLWFYILKEAEMQQRGERLGEVGSTIVAETLFGLAWCDHYSYLYQMPSWKPGDEFDGLKNLDMLKLTQFVYGD
jgi:Animal haem peroxidase